MAFTKSPWIGPLLCLVTALFLGVWTGSSGIDVFELLARWVQGEAKSLDWTIVTEIRLPRVLSAALCGGALSVAGVVSQGLFRNSLASPTIIGTSGGGALAAAVTFYFGLASAAWYAVPLAASAGALAATSVIFVLSKRLSNWSIEHLLLVGFALNAFLGSLTSLTISLALEDFQRANAAMHWLLGGFSGRGWEHFQIGIIPVTIGCVAAYRVATKLNILSLGEEVAGTLSVDVDKLRTQSILVLALLVGTAVSIAGALPFIGLIVPHSMRRIFGPENRGLVISSALGGAAFTVVADIIARTVRSPLEIEVGVLTSLLGAPFFLILLLGKGGGSR